MGFCLGFGMALGVGSGCVTVVLGGSAAGFSHGVSGWFFCCCWCESLYEQKLEEPLAAVSVLLAVSGFWAHLVHLGSVAIYVVLVHQVFKRLFCCNFWVQFLAISGFNFLV